MSLSKRLKDWERGVRNRYNVDPRIPENARRAEIYNNWFDHAILRTFWTNFFEIAPGVYRSNNPTHERFVEMQKSGIHTVLNLRGKSNSAHYWAEEIACETLGLNLINCPLNARAAAPREALLLLIEIFKTIERPFVMHCKSGADRAGFASAIYLIVIEGKSVAEARQMLSIKYIHLKFTKTGILDYILRNYQARNDRDEISFETWVATEYDHTELQAAFNNKKAIAA
jgi:protein tyrosine/serine phosphatase